MLNISAKKGEVRLIAKNSGHIQKVKSYVLYRIERRKK